MFSLYGIYHTQKTVFDHISTPKRAENAMHSGVFLTNFGGVWKCGQTMS